MGQRLLVCLGGTKFAECFFCKQQGHLSKNCPQNAHGIYPKGGYCKICGGVTHSARDCPEKGKKAPFAANGPADGYTIGLSSTGLASVQVPSDPVQRMVFDEIHGYSLTSINPFLDDSSPKDHAFVDEFSCIAKIPIILYLSKKNLLKNFQENIGEMRFS